MPMQRTFFDVLSELIHEKPSENFTPAWESSLEPAWLSQLVGTIEPRKAALSSLSRYGRPVRKSHIFDEKQAEAYSLLNRYQSKTLHPGFYFSELKSAYRAALLKTHPDQGGTAENFHQVRKSYEILLSFVTK